MTIDDAKRPRFRRRTAAVAGAADPETLFGELPRTPNGVGALWSHQADQLRTYAIEHRATPDVALELPTGSGKTLVGLLISEWRRRTLGQRVIYACPTKQLTRQVLQKANDQGIPAVLLIGSHRDWDQAELSRYTRGDAIAITAYSAIFNLNSHLGDAQTLVFDDAHAAEGFVAEAWALNVNRKLGQYEQLFDALGDSVEPTFVARMIAPDGPAADASEVRLIPVGAVARHAEDIDRVLAGLNGDPMYRFRMLRENLTSCLFYVSRRGFYIRPMIPPTFEHGPYTDPIQRLYLSATLGDAGELERAFGRADIKRVPVPTAWDRAGSGRRFFVFPELAAPPSEVPGNVDDIEVAPDAGLVGDLLDLARKRLVLTPDDNSAIKIADLLGVPASERFTAKDADTGIQPFIDADRGTLLAPNRYDGMDLAADSCRMMLMSGLPTASHLQDRFLETKLRASEVLQERIRTRVLQGAGRCTRGPKDWAVVVVVGEDILRFLSRAEVRKSLPVELQAEITFGLEQSQEPGDDLVYLAESALEQDQIWQEDAEPELAKLRREASREPQPNVAELAASTLREVRAWTYAWQQDWESAARAAVEVFENLQAPGLRPYRALWAYLGSAWSALASTDDASPAALRSSDLLRKAHTAAVGTTWLKEVQPLPSANYDSDPVDAEGVEGVLALLKGRLSSPVKFENQSANMLAHLNQREATKYEQGLVALGQILGSEAFKPPSKGRADAAWVWESFWMTLEAKSEQESEGMLSMDYVRQTNTQLASLAADRGVEAPPEGSISIIVSPRSVVDPDAVPIAAPQVYLAAPKLVLDIAHDAVRAWKELRGIAKGVGGEVLHATVARILWEHRVLPTQVRERLSRDPIRGS
ncbi:DEAD/DEAH box helicase [Streptomyces sp. NBC_00620]|uniref:DEAD/DEAH box helicase n=1 Tax=Streptomyces sp. NBC_00620 TaxID=2903666 RepID=UPI00225B2B9B|nr:DEAD/DEAH box helicase [Streptomyces sp. NBC_00620]MCX4974995.1 DEAD/DEAH box helicase [Streptomyces sp. NBC_00620]